MELVCREIIETEIYIYEDKEEYNTHKEEMINRGFHIENEMSIGLKLQVEYSDKVLGEVYVERDME